jgi:RNA recognition motif-containing protein
MAGIMSTPLFIEGFPPSVSAQELFALFAPYGRVISVELATSWDGRPLRIADIQMERSEDADWAVRLLHRSHMDGELILVFRLPEDILPALSALKGQPEGARWDRSVLFHST